MSTTDTNPKGETGAFDAEALAIVRGHYNSTDATAARAIAAALQRAHDAGETRGLATGRAEGAADLNALLDQRAEERSGVYAERDRLTAELAESEADHLREVKRCEAYIAERDRFAAELGVADTKALKWRMEAETQAISADAYLQRAERFGRELVEARRLLVVVRRRAEHGPTCGDHADGNECDCGYDDMIEELDAFDPPAAPTIGVAPEPTHGCATAEECKAKGWDGHMSSAPVQVSPEPTPAEPPMDLMQALRDGLPCVTCGAVNEFVDEGGLAKRHRADCPHYRAPAAEVSEPTQETARKCGPCGGTGQYVRPSASTTFGPAMTCGYCGGLGRVPAQPGRCPECHAPGGGNPLTCTSCQRRRRGASTPGAEAGVPVRPPESPDVQPPRYLTCPRCLSAPGEDCRTLDGTAQTAFHRERALLLIEFSELRAISVATGWAAAAPAALPMVETRPLVPVCWACQQGDEPTEFNVRRSGARPCSRCGIDTCRVLAAPSPDSSTLNAHMTCGEWYGAPMGAVGMGRCGLPRDHSGPCGPSTPDDGEGT